MGIKKGTKVQRGVKINTAKAVKEINQYRIDNRLTKQGLSKKLGITPQTLHRILNGLSKLEFRTIEKLTNVGINIEITSKQ